MIITKVQFTEARVDHQTIICVTASDQFLPPAVIICGIAAIKKDDDQRTYYLGIAVSCISKAPSWPSLLLPDN